MARLIITAVVVEGRPQAQVARDYRSHAWVSISLPAGGSKATRRSSRAHDDHTPARRRPHRQQSSWSSSSAHDSPSRASTPGRDTIVWHLAQRHQRRAVAGDGVSDPAPHRSGTPEPQQRPRSSYIRFEADQPNECWQADFTHHRLADSTDVEILCWIDDHSRYAISVTAHRRVTGPIVVNAFTAALETHAIPVSTLTDNGMVFTTRLSGGRGGRNGFETLLDSLGVVQKNSRPNHPTTCGKVERFHQTLKKWLRAHPPPPPSPSCNATRRIRRLTTTTTARTAHYTEPPPPPPTPPAPKPPPPAPTTHTHGSATTASTTGNVTLRIAGQLHHIGLGRTLDGTRIIMLINDLDVRIIHATTGEIIRTLTIDPNRRYHGTGKPPAAQTTTTPKNERPEP